MNPADRARGIRTLDPLLGKQGLKHLPEAKRWAFDQHPLLSEQGSRAVDDQRTHKPSVIVRKVHIPRATLAHSQGYEVGHISAVDADAGTIEVLEAAAADLPRHRAASR